MEDIHGNFVMGGLEGRSHCGFHGGHTVTIDHAVLSLVVDRSEKPIHDVLSSALRKRDAYICPHLRSSSPELFGGRSMTAEYPNHPFLGMQDATSRDPCGAYQNLGNQLRGGKCVVWSQWPCQDCFTRYCLKRRPNGRYQRRIFLEGSCDLLGSPIHPSWLSQIVPTRRVTLIESRSTNTNTGERGDVKCSARFESCKGQCCLAPYHTFVNS
jgi:hypothetical protein